MPNATLTIATILLALLATAIVAWVRRRAEEERQDRRQADGIARWWASGAR